MKMIFAFIISAFLTFPFDQLSGQNTSKLTQFASGISSPVCITNAGDSRLFVVDQRGQIKIVDADGTIKSQSFLDIRDRVVYGGERGLLGLAFHPQYKTNGYFYVNYIGEGGNTFISRFTRNTTNPDLADAQSELKLLNVVQPYQNHNGGDLKFGPDGFLYIGLGDGGSGGDPGNRSQNRMTLLGKLLRIDVNKGELYAIPPSNPYVNNTNTLPEIWALGLRNPWRFSFDRLSGDLWIADVGQNKFEEINFQAANSPGGENYGWRCYEANAPYNTSGCVADATLTFPVHTFPLGTECSVTGGFVYRGNAASPYYGHYFFTDYCSDKIWTLYKENGSWVKEDFGQFAGNNFSTFGEDASGQLYIAGLKSGKLFKFSDLSTKANVLPVQEEINVTQTQFTNKIRIETRLNSQSFMQLSVFDIRGSKQFSEQLKAENQEIDFSFLNSGVYILSVIFDGKTKNFKFVCTH